MATSVSLSAKIATKFSNSMNDVNRALEDALGNLNTQNSTLKRILTGILSKNSENSELEANLYRQ